VWFALALAFVAGILVGGSIVTAAVYFVFDNAAVRR